MLRISIGVRLFAILLLGLLPALIPFHLHAQDKYMDSLKQELSKKNTDSARIPILLELGDKGGYYDSRQARVYLDEAFKLAQKQKKYYSMGAACAYIGSLYYYKDNYDSALLFYNRGIGFLKKDTSLDARMSIATIQSEIADVSVAHGDFEAAVAIYLRVIDTLKYNKPDNYNDIGNLYLAVGSVYRRMTQFTKSLFYNKKGLAELEKDKSNPVAYGFAALYCAADLISLSEFDEAIKYLIQTQQLADKLHSFSLSSQLYNAWGKYYNKTGNGYKAVASYEKAIQFAKLANDKFDQASALARIGNIYLDKKEYKSGLPYLQHALAIMHSLGDKHREQLTLKSLAIAYAALHRDREAVRYYQEYIRLSDSLNEQETKQKINDIDAKYQAQKKQAQIITLQKNNQLQQLEIQHDNFLNLVLVLGFILLLMLAVLLFINFKNKNRILKQSDTLHKQRIRELEQERHLVVAQSLLKGQEEERSRLARDLHDGVGGLLSGVKLCLSTMKGNFILTNENAQAFDNAVWQLDQSIAELRRVSHNMMPEALIKFGLKETLENYCENLNLTGHLQVTLQTYGLEQRLDQNTEIVIYRIIQELLNNIIRHAEAKNVLIQLIREENRFTLTVEDDGKGFNIEEANNKNGAGLSNIKARAEYLGGTVDIRSSQGEGTSIHIEGKVSD